MLRRGTRGASRCSKRVGGEGALSGLRGPGSAVEGYIAGQVIIIVGVLCYYSLLLQHTYMYMYVPVQSSRCTGSLGWMSCCSVLRRAGLGWAVRVLHVFASNHRILLIRVICRSHLLVVVCFGCVIPPSSQQERKRGTSEEKSNDTDTDADADTDTDTVQLPAMHDMRLRDATSGGSYLSFRVCACSLALPAVRSTSGFSSQAAVSLSIRSDWRYLLIHT